MIPELILCIFGLPDPGGQAPFRPYAGLPSPKGAIFAQQGRRSASHSGPRGTDLPPGPVGHGPGRARAERSRCRVPFLRYVSCARPHRLRGLAFRCLWAAGGLQRPGGAAAFGGAGGPSPGPAKQKARGGGKASAPRFSGRFAPCRRPPGPLEPANGATGPPRRKSKYPAKQQRRKPSSARLPQGLPPGKRSKSGQKTHSTPEK